MPLTLDQKTTVLDLYKKTGLPSDRLPHSPQLNLIAETANVPASAAWRFLYNCRRPSSDSRLAITVGRGGRTGTTLPKLREKHTDLFESEIPTLINSAENSVYGSQFAEFAAKHPERTIHEWAVDLIRYRKQKNEKRRQQAKRNVLATGTVSDTNEIVGTITVKTTIVATPAIAVPAFVFSIASKKDNLFYLGTGPQNPASYVVLASIEEGTYDDLRRTLRRDEVAPDVYRLQPGEVQYVLDTIGDGVYSDASDRLARA